MCRRHVDSANVAALTNSPLTGSEMGVHVAAILHKQSFAHLVKGNPHGFRTQIRSLRVSGSIITANSYSIVTARGFRRLLGGTESAGLRCVGCTGHSPIAYYGHLPILYVSSRLDQIQFYSQNFFILGN